MSLVTLDAARQAAAPATAHADRDEFPAALMALAGPLLRAHAAAGGLPVALKDAETGIYRYVNDAMAALFGRAAVDVVGRTDAQLLSAPRAAALRAADQTAIAQHPFPSETVHRFEWRGRRHHWAALRIVAPDPTAAGSRTIASIWTDRCPADEQAAALASLKSQIEREQRLLERLRREATGIDGTGAGQPAFEEHLRRELDLSSRERREFALLLIEIDPPPPDAPPRGDAVVEAIAEGVDRLVLANTRAMDASSRLSSTRSAVLLSGVGLATGFTRGDALRQQCAGYAVMHAGESVGFTVSVGVASFPHTAGGRDALAGAALKALARARAQGGNQARLSAVRFPRPHGARSTPLA